MTKLPLRPNVCMLLFNADGKLFLGERNGEPGKWQFPQGGAEPELTLEANVLKELEEELGLAASKIEIVRKLETTREYEFDRTPAYAVGVWRGQSQTFWLVEFKGSDADIDLFRHAPEFMSWRWCDPMEVRTLAEPRRLVGYEPAIREFEQYLHIVKAG